MFNHQLAKRFQNVLAVEPTLDLDRQALAGALVDHGEHAELAPVAGSILDKIVSPDMVSILRAKPDARAVIEP